MVSVKFLEVNSTPYVILSFEFNAFPANGRHIGVIMFTI